MSHGRRVFRDGSIRRGRDAASALPKSFVADGPVTSSGAAERSMMEQEKTRRGAATGLCRLLAIRRALQQEIRGVGTGIDRVEISAWMREARVRGGAREALARLEQRIEADFPGALAQQDAGRVMMQAEPAA